MKATKIASAFLDVRRAINDEKDHSVYKFAKDRKPIITPLISANGTPENGQQFLLIPNNEHIIVKSLEHGDTIMQLSSGDDSSDPPSLHTAIVLEMTKGSMSREDYNDDNTMDSDTSPTEFVVVAGFSDGCLREWNLSAIPYSKNIGVMMPRRTFKFGFNGSISHITSPSGNGNGSIYVLITSIIGSKRETKLVQFCLPVCDDLSEIIILDNDHLAKFCKKKDVKKNCEDSKTLGKELKYFFSGPSPFALLSTSAIKGNGEKDYFVGIFHKSGFVLYYENAEKFLSIPKTQNDSIICAAAMSPNGVDVAIGHVNGKIDVLTSVLSQTADLLNLSETGVDRNLPKESLVIRTIHWHSLPVKTLCYLGSQGSRATPSLLSGGEEAVLVTWSIDRGVNRPSHTLPRISKGCITHIATNSHPASNSGSMDIIVKCLDETLQLIQGHNHAIRWKVQGLACALNECVPPVEISGESKKTYPSILQVDPKSKVPMISRMAGAPGFIHWYDPKSSQVVGELEIAAYNRISRRDSDHKSYPRPTVTHMAFSNSGNDLVTIDTMLSENANVGKVCKVDSFTTGSEDSSEEMSFITNIKFWTWSRDLEKNAKKQGRGMPYELIAAMPAPHGIANGFVDALAISPNGSIACTLSRDEGSFHIWAKEKPSNMSTGPSWKRLCRITIPAGYSNAPVANCDEGNLVTFSPDGSVLAIVFGRHVTLWDHSTATMLNSVQAIEPLKDIRFIRYPIDMLLVTGESSVSILPPFGNGYLGDAAWSYKLPKDFRHYEKFKLQMVTPVFSRKDLAVAVTRTARNGDVSTKVIIVDLVTAKAKTNEDGSAITWDIAGTLQTLNDISNAKNDWSSTTSEQESNPVLLALTSENEMYVLEEGNISTHVRDQDEDNLVTRGCFARIENSRAADALSSNTAPKIEGAKRRRIAESSEKSQFKRPYLSDNMVGAFLFDPNSMDTESGPVPTSKLPALSGSFARSFIARNIMKKSS